MNQTSTSHDTQPPTLTVVFLWVLAVLLASVGSLYGLMRLVLADRFDSLVVLSSLGYLVVGQAGGCVLWALAYMVRCRNEVAADGPRIPKQAKISNPASTPTEKPPASIDPETAQHILAELSEINTNLLLSERERQAKRHSHNSQLAGTIADEVGEAIKAGDFAQAERAAERMGSELGDPGGRELLRERVAEARAAATVEHVAAETHRAEELMAMASFRQARDVARQLLETCPDSQEAKALLERVSREADIFTSEQRKRLYGEVQRAAESRRWRAAFASAHRLLAEYPNSPEADEVALTMPTIQENSRIEEARELRDEIRDLIRRRRYHEAIRIARDILARFPDTQAAAELREQIPRLEDLADK